MSTPTPEPERKGLPRWAVVMLIAVAVIVIGFGICVALISGATSA